MDGRERAGILDPQSRQRIDVEKPPIVDVAGGKPPMPEPVVLALQQVMQRDRLRRPVGSGPERFQSARDDLVTPGYAAQFCLEGRRFLALGWRKPLWRDVRSRMRFPAPLPSAPASLMMLRKISP